MVDNVSLREGVVPPALKEAKMCSFLKKPSLDPAVLDNKLSSRHPIFWEGVDERVVGSLLQRGPDEEAYLYLFQSGFRLGYGMSKTGSQNVPVQRLPTHDYHLLFEHKL